MRVGELTIGGSNMTIQEFARAYLDMRSLQREFFKTRDKGVLQKAKQAERTLDNHARVILNPKEETNDNQQSLF